MNTLLHRRITVALALAGALSLCATSSIAAPQRTLTVCADPNNLPFSNKAQQGFENRIMSLIARELGARIEYVWWAQRRGYVRNTLSESRCDVWPGVAVGVDRVVTTHPYYRSTYVFVTRKEQPLSGLSLDDARLRDLSIGVQMVGNDAMNTPPAHAVARRGMIDNVRGFMLYGDYTRPNPPAAIVDAVASEKVDVAMVWGPLAGYFASRSTVPLRLEPVTPASDGPQWPMTYAIGMGTKRENEALREQIDAILNRRKSSIEAILREYHVPLLDTGGASVAVNR